MRIKVDWRSSSKENYRDFCKKNPHIKLSFDEWRNIVYGFNDIFRNTILETGERLKLPYGFGEFSINKKKRKKKKVTADGQEYINLPIDWVKTKEKGKYIYNMNYHTEGYFFGWIWFKDTARLRLCDHWYFKPTRTTSRLLTHYLKTDSKYQHTYATYKV